MPKQSSSSQKLLPRKPRVQIEYDVETNGAIRKVELPWVTGVLADLSGANSDQLADIKDRKFAEVDADNFDEYLKSQKPRVRFAVENQISGEGQIGVDLSFESLGEFRPDLVARKVGAETEDVLITRHKEGRGYLYRIAQDGPASLALGESTDSMDNLANVTFVAYKMGVQPDDLEVQVVPDIRDPDKFILRVTRKGPLAKLLDARNQLQELLLKVDGNSDAKKALERLIEDPELLSGIVDAGQTVQQAD
jgi:type VI secretion system ImpB/VipA family protein